MYLCVFVQFAQQIETFVLYSINRLVFINKLKSFDVLLTVYLSIFISAINQLDAQNFCFTVSLFHASTCFEHMSSKHVEAWNKLIVKQKFCASSWLITEINNKKLLYAFFWVIPRRLNCICRHFGTLCSIFVGRYLPMKMEQTECSETSVYKIQKQGIYPEESTEHSEHGESLKSKIIKKILPFLKPQILKKPFKKHVNVSPSRTEQTQFILSKVICLRTI